MGGHAGAGMRRGRGRPRSGVEGTITSRCRGLDHGAGQAIAIGRWPSHWAWRRGHERGDQVTRMRGVMRLISWGSWQGGGHGGMTGTMDVEGEADGAGRVWGKGPDGIWGEWWVHGQIPWARVGLIIFIGPCCCGFRRRRRLADSQQHSGYP
jgi:hypothetical protein